MPHPPTEGLVLIDGRRFVPEGASVSVYDRGFLYGDSVFEVIRTYGGKAFGLRDHIERLHRSAGKIALTLPWSVDELCDEIARGIADVEFDEAYVRIVVTRGAGALGLDPDLADTPRRVILIHPLTLPPPEVYRDGVSVLAVETLRATDDTPAMGAKASNYLANLLALREAKKWGAYEALFLRREADALQVLEGATSNVFALFRRGGARPELVTPPEGRILSGITRRHVLAAAPAAGGLEVRVEPLTLDQLLKADEVILTSTVRELVPVVKVHYIDGPHTIGRGRPGEGYRALHEAFRAHVGAGTSPMPWE